MKLNSYKPRMIFAFCDLRQKTIGRSCDNVKTAPFKFFKVICVDFIPVAVTFSNDGVIINFTNF